MHSLDVSNIKRMEELVKQLLLSIEDAIDSKVAQKMEDVGANGYLLEKNVLSIDDVVMLTGLSKSHVYKLTSSRQLPFYKPNGKLMYFDKKEIEEILSNSICTSFIYSNRINPIFYGLEIQLYASPAEDVEYSDYDYSRTAYFYFKTDSIPEYIKEKYSLTDDIISNESE